MEKLENKTIRFEPVSVSLPKKLGEISSVSNMGEENTLESYNWTKKRLNDLFKGTDFEGLNLGMLPYFSSNLTLDGNFGNFLTKYRKSTNLVDLSLGYNPLFRKIGDDEKNKKDFLSYLAQMQFEPARLNLNELEKGLIEKLNIDFDDDEIFDGFGLFRDKPGVFNLHKDGIGQIALSGGYSVQNQNHLFVDIRSTKQLIPKLEEKIRYSIEKIPYLRLRK